MRLRQWIWGLLLIAGGTLLLLDVLPGSDAFADGPRIGMAMALWTLATLILGAPLVTWYLRKTTHPQDYEGACPVGKVCPRCDAFNFNPRTECRMCRTDLTNVGPATREPL